MKIGFFPKKRDACYWYRILGPSSHLAMKGHEVQEEVLEQLYVCDCGHQEYQEFHYYNKAKEFCCSKCGKVGVPESTITAWRKNIEDIINWSDIVVFQRTTHDDHFKLMQLAREKGKKVYLDFDDDYFNVEKWNPGFEYYKDKKEHIANMLRFSDHVTVTTRALQQLYSEYNKNVHILPNSLDIELIDALPALSNFFVYDCNGKSMLPDEFRRRVGNRKMIVWGGSPTHEHDLKIMWEALVQVIRKENAVIVFVGYILSEILATFRKLYQSELKEKRVPKDMLFLVGLVAISEYFPLYKALKMDIILAPVVSNKFNASKSNLKIIEAMTLRALPIASDSETYSAFINEGLLACDEPWDWKSQMRRAINMPEAERKERVDSNRKYVEENFDVKNNVSMWEDLYKG